MKVTAKQIAEKMGISAAAVSMALNNKPGVSVEMRHQIIDVATEMGYDFTRINQKNFRSNTIAFIFFHKNFVFDTPFFTELATSVEQVIKENGYQLFALHIHDLDDIHEKIKSIQSYNFEGILLLGTTMSRDDFEPFQKLDIPLVLLDSYFPNVNADCVTINNVDSAETATDYLIKKRHEQPGYLHSTQNIVNFSERTLGFFNAVRKNSMPTSKSIIHHLSPSLDGAYADMLEILNHNEPIATCYFADNDEIAIGAMRALKEKGYRVPEDVSIIGFDNIPYATYVDPPLTTIHVPKSYMGVVAAKRLLSSIRDHDNMHVKIEINTELILRNSI
ncbi:LacI family transcriptional regulator [Breznakia blatticola]|uniref:LacI family transcriptional regulator n=1 Tax=Breznakia blatticola TaxID=1754012 RepID=A0A4R7Z909_9FIRM|nr:LacI family DNA-binding transcriptional regulator [Breznakia blatticola]TDW13230.1 LacI family transcriptional regulator [Breznakia blatticola]